MPVVPSISTLNANAAGILNTIRANASDAYREAVPTAEQTTTSIRSVGQVIMGYEARRNEFINALVNRIAMVLVTSKSYQNPLRMFKRGMMEMGETVEEVFVRLAEPFQYDATVAESEVFKRVIPDVKSMFHPLNYKKFYKTTFSNETLRQAFLSPQGVTDLISRIVEQMYTAMNYDEYIMMKYVIYTLATSNQLPTKVVSALSADNANAIVTELRAASNNFEFMSTDYNIAGVENYSLKDNQYLLLSSNASATIDVNSLAKAFNLSYVEYVGRQVLVDHFDFSASELKRLDALMADDPDYTTPSTANNSAMAGVVGILVDRDWFMIFDNLMESTNIYNPQNLCWNQFLHTWKTFSVSPFANCLMFTTTASAVTKVEVSGDATYTPGKGSQYKASVTTTGSAFAGVKFSISGNASAATYITDDGMLVVGNDETAATITVTATSLFDSMKAGTKSVAKPS